MLRNSRPLIALTCLLTLTACGPFQPTAADKEICVTVDDLKELGLDAQVVAAGERWVATKGVGTRQLIYDYNQPMQQDSEQILFIHCQASTQRTSLEAMTAYQMSILTSKAISIGDLEQRRHSEGRCKGADACVLIDFRAKDRVIGNHFVVRSGRHVIAVTLLGPHFDDLDEWRGVVTQKIETMKRQE